MAQWEIIGNGCCGIHMSLVILCCTRCYCIYVYDYDDDDDDDDDVDDDVDDDYC